MEDGGWKRESRLLVSQSGALDARGGTKLFYFFDDEHFDWLAMPSVVLAPLSTKSL